MVPAQPGEAGAVGREAWIGEEVVAARQHRLGAGGEVDRDDGVDRLAGAGVIFADRDQPAAGGVEQQIGVAHRAFARHRPRRLAAAHAPDPLVGVVAEEQLAVGSDGEGAAAVLVDPVAHVEGRRVHVFAAPGGIALDDDVAATLGRPAFAREDRAAGERDLAEPDRRRGELGSRQGRGPAAEGGGAHP
jgi:hypothetical protein